LFVVCAVSLAWSGCRFDIETGGNINPTVNHNWLQAAIGRAVQRIGGNRIGIYASKYEWGQVRPRSKAWNHSVSVCIRNTCFCSLL